MARRIPLSEARVKVEALTTQRNINDLKRDGEFKFFEAAVLNADSAKSDEIRHTLHELLDEQLDGIIEMYTLMRLVKDDPPY